MLKEITGNKNVHAGSEMLRNFYSLQTSFLMQPTKFFTKLQPAFEIYKGINLTGHLQDLAGLDCSVVGRVGDGARHRHLLQKPGRSPIKSRPKKTTLKGVWQELISFWFFSTKQFPPCPWIPYRSNFKFLRKFVNNYYRYRRTSYRQCRISFAVRNSSNEYMEPGTRVCIHPK